MSGFRINNKKFLLTYTKLDVAPVFFNETFHEYMEKLKGNRIKYMICCLEDHKQTEGKHIHVYVEFESAISTRDQSYFDMLNIHPNIETVTKTPWKAVDYVMKDGDYYETDENIRPRQPFDKMSKSEKNSWLLRNDLKECVDSGAVSLLSLKRLKENINIYKQLVDKKELRLNLKVKWFYGETGSGKTKAAIEECMREYNDYWKWNGNLQWFDGYEEHKAVIIDDFRRQDIKFNYLLQLFDIYPIRVPVKGGFVNWKPELIIVTCPVDSREAWQWMDKDGEMQDWDCIEQLERRISEHREFKN